MVREIFGIFLLLFFQSVGSAQFLDEDLLGYSNEPEWSLDPYEDFWLEKKDLLQNRGIFSVEQEVPNQRFRFYSKSSFPKAPWEPDCSIQYMRRESSSDSSRRGLETLKLKLGLKLSKEFQIHSLGIQDRFHSDSWRGGCDMRWGFKSGKPELECFLSPTVQRYRVQAPFSENELVLRLRREDWDSFIRWEWRSQLDRKIGSGCYIQLGLSEMWIEGSEPDPRLHLQWSWNSDRENHFEVWNVFHHSRRNIKHPQSFQDLSISHMVWIYSPSNYYHQRIGYEWRGRGSESLSFSSNVRLGKVESMGVGFDFRNFVSQDQKKVDRYFMSYQSTFVDGCDWTIRWIQPNRIQLRVLYRW